MRATARHLLGLGLLLALSGSLPAAEPPALINYQGVLRDSSDTPLNGAWHTIFRFFSAETGGDEILIDEHPNASEKEVLVTNGLFSVALGSGDLFDGSGPGVYGSLAEVFRDYGEVWLEVEIDGETLTPRVRVVSAAFALNADHLDGNDSSDFLDTSSTGQTKEGRLTVNSPEGIAVVGWSPGGGAEFQDTDDTSYVRLAYGGYGLRATGSTTGGYFRDGIGTGDALLGHEGYGIKAGGNQAAGRFDSWLNSTFVELAQDHVGIWSEATNTGAYFKASAGSYGEVWVAHEGIGISAIGENRGGEFHDSLYTGEAILAESGFGIKASGITAGGYFEDTDDSAYANLAILNHGVEGYGNAAGGYFNDLNSSGSAWVAYGDVGIEAHGTSAGAYFRDYDQTGYAYLGYGDFGIESKGNEAGGYFEDSNGSSIVWVGRNDNGISSYGTLMGGYFEDSDSGTVSRIAYGGYGIDSTGTKNFVQNHPFESDKVIVYSSLEGDEVGTYTRGTARLENGLARVELDETFRWVTNPDIGLTVHLTPVGEWSELYVVERSTFEIVVGSRDGAPDVAFDYIVHGLRIGFEEVGSVREKDGEAYLPSMANQRELYERRPELRRFSALERFTAMTADLRGVEADGFEPDLDAARALRAAVQEYDPEVHGRIGPDRPGSIEDESVPTSEIARHPVADMRDGGGEGAAPAEGATPSAGVAPTALALPVDEEGNVYGRSFRPSAGDLATMVEAAEAVEVGDVLVIDPERPGLVGLARQAEDTAVFGIVAAEPGLVLGAAQPGQPQGNPVPVALSGIVLCKADAGYGEIRPGDLLTTSPTAGHAMRAGEPLPGTILGKALEPLDAGTGRIRVLVTIR